MVLDGPPPQTYGCNCKHTTFLKESQKFQEGNTVWFTHFCKKPERGWGTGDGDEK